MKATHNPPTTDVAVTPADILRGAALYIARHGWTQGTYFADESGTYDLPAHASYSHLTPPACPLGALAMATFGQRFPEDFYDLPEWSDYKRAEDALLRYLDHVYPALPDDTDPQPEIGDWNDQPDRTAADVITALREAADEWDRTHTLAGASA